MNARFVPLLQVQRDLYAIPRGQQRFDEYLRTMLNLEQTDIRVPLPALNPMAKEHAPALLDRWLALDADGEAARAIEAAAIGPLDEPLRVCLVLADDLKGAWTNRYAAEFSDRFENAAMLKRGWAPGLLWTSDEPGAALAKQAALAAAYRAARIAKKGPAKTLGEMLDQEGEALAAAGVPPPAWDEAEAARIAAVIEPLRGAAERWTQLSCLFGDPCAEELGYDKLGLPRFAGLDYANLSSGV